MVEAQDAVRPRHFYPGGVLPQTDEMLGELGKPQGP